MKLRIVPALAILALAVVASGCGEGGKSISDVRSCLKKLKLNVEKAPSNDKDVKEGVFASTDLTKGKPENLTIALAAVAKNSKSVKEFEKQSKDFAKTLEQGDGPKLQVESGTDGDYVWVVMGKKSKSGYQDARDCVKA